MAILREGRDARNLGRYGGLVTAEKQPALATETQEEVGKQTLKGQRDDDDDSRRQGLGLSLHSFSLATPVRS